MMPGNSFDFCRPLLRQIKACAAERRYQKIMMPDSTTDWMPIGSAPFGRDLEVAVIDEQGAHTLVTPCRRISAGWIDAGTAQLLHINPTHWRSWRPR
jgi:hypothetical protein